MTYFSAVVQQINKDSENEWGLFQELMQFDCSCDESCEAVDHNESTLLDAVSDLSGEDGIFSVEGTIELVYDLDDEFIPDYEINIKKIEKQNESKILPRQST